MRREENGDYYRLEGAGNRELVSNGCRVSAGEYEKVLEMGSGNNCIRL